MKRTARNGCPTKTYVGSRRGQPRMAVLPKPTDHGGSQDAWNKSAAGAYYLAGGGPCIATDAGTSSPLGGNTARSAGRRYCRVARRHLQPRRGKWPVLPELTRGLRDLTGDPREFMG